MVAEFKLTAPLQIEVEITVPERVIVIPAHHATRTQYLCNVVGHWHRTESSASGCIRRDGAASPKRVIFDIQEVLDLAASGVSYVAIGRKIGRSKNRVSQIVAKQRRIDARAVELHDWSELKL